MPCLVQLIKPAVALVFDTGELCVPWCLVPPRKVTTWPSMGEMTWERTSVCKQLDSDAQVIFSRLTARSPFWEVGRPTQPGPHPPQKAAGVCLTGQGSPEVPLRGRNPQLLCAMGSVGPARPLGVLTIPVLRADGGQYPSNQWLWHPRGAVGWSCTGPATRGMAPTGRLSSFSFLPLLSWATPLITATHGTSPRVLHLLFSILFCLCFHCCNLLAQRSLKPSSRCQCGLQSHSLDVPSNTSGY